MDVIASHCNRHTVTGYREDIIHFGHIQKTYHRLNIENTDKIEGGGCLHYIYRHCTKYHHSLKYRIGTVICFHQSTLNNI